MGRIKELDYNTVVKIAAGEVIDRPASVVRELIDNAIDAGADQIAVHIEHGGKSYLEVRDNGRGMDAGDLARCTLNHSTSKIHNFEDLETLQTLGFRGEALSSIVEVSDTTLSSREKNDIEGHTLNVHFGTHEEIRAEGMNTGTRVTVRDLFAKMPARLKFLGTDSTETRYISREIIKKALAFPEISFEFVVSGRQKSFSGKKNNVFERITDYYPDTARYLLPIEAAGDGFRLNGFLSKPAFLRPNRMYQYFFVNGRAVEWKPFSFAVHNAYGNLIPRGQFSAVFLYVEIEPELVDFNVHPMKREVRFKNEYGFSREVQHILANSLMADDGIAEAEESQIRFNAYEQRVADAIEGFVRKSKDITPALGFKESRAFIPTQEKSAPEKTSVEKSDFSSEPRISQNKDDKTKPAEVDSVLNYRFAGVLFSTYLIMEGPERVIFVDQHAAHERINYEKLKKRYRGETFATQELLVPVKTEVPVEIADTLKAQLETLRAMGFEIEHFGGTSFVIRAVPEYIDYADAADVVMGFVEVLMENRNSDLHAADFVDNALKQMSCKASIRAGDHITQAEVYGLLRELLSTPNPFSCPHGRPIMFSLSRNDIEKQFKRQGF